MPVFSPANIVSDRGKRCTVKPKNMQVFQDKLNLKRKIISDKISELAGNPDAKDEVKKLKIIEGDMIREQKNGPKTKSHIVWPAATRNSAPRTHDNVKAIVDAIAEDPNLSKHERKGVVGRSPLWDVEGFDFVRDSPTEYMHSVCIGVVKRMLELTFSVGEVRPRETKRKLSSPSEFNECMKDTQSPREFSRRSRKLDLAVFKAQEMRNILLFFFPHILQCIEPNAKERRLWLLFTFMIRSCILPSNEFQIVDLSKIEEACEAFYILYEQLFGAYNCSYNTHVVSSHLIEMRAHGPLTFTSAFGFEAFYGEMRHSFTPGTQSTLKQIMRKTLMKRAISYHCCNNSIYYSERDSSLECNSLIYCYEASEHNMFKIINVQKDSLICYKQGKYPVSFKETRDLDLNWSHVGVYKRGVS